MRPVIQMLGESFIYTCTFDKAFTYEQFVPEHILAYQIAGQTHIFHQRGEMVLEEGQLLLAHRNQLAKRIKIPAGISHSIYFRLLLFLISISLFEASGFD